MKRIKLGAIALLHPVTAMLIGLAIGALAILLVGASVIDTYAELWNGAFGSFYYFTNTLTRATPIILIGLGLALSFRAGFFNLGAEGQMVLGAISAALTALYLPGPGWMKLIAAFIAGIVAGGIWSALAGWFDAKFKVNLLMTTLLLNYIAIYFTAYLSGNPFMDKTGSAALPQTKMLDPSSWLPKLFQGSNMHAGFLIAAVATIVLFWFMRNTVTGYEMNMSGSNAQFAAYGGIRRVPLVLASMFVSGGFAGLAGSVEVLGMQHRFLDGALTAPGFAWSGLMAALLANSHPLGTALAAVLLAALQTGAMGVERNTDVPLEISGVIQSVIIVFVSAKFGYSFLKRKKARRANGAPI